MSKSTHPPLTQSVGEQIRKARKASNITQAQLADKLGISQQFIAKIEKGISVPSLTLLHDIGLNLACSFTVGKIN